VALTTDRGLSITLNYAITLGITALLVVGLLLASGAFESAEREAVTEDRLRSIGERLAGEIEAVDRLNRSAEGAIRSEVVLPAAVAGSPYRVQITATDGRGTVKLTATGPGVSVAVSFTSRTRVRDGTVTGGPVVVRADAEGVEVVHA
jgi:hypothetical protein